MNTLFRSSAERLHSQPTEARTPRTELPPKETTIVVTVRAVSDREDMIRVDGPQGEYYLLGKRIMGSLWGHVQRGDTLELVVQLDPGKATKIFSVHLPAF